MSQAKSDICSMTGVEQAKLIRNKLASPVEVLDAVLDRIEKLEPHLHAFCTPTEDLARTQAKAAEDAVMRGDPLGPLHGVPISIKDLICTQGIRTMSGSKAYEDFVPEEDDIVVERTMAAGAVMLGKTNVAELGYGGVGYNLVAETTRNPWNIDKTPGGSSAGSAAAVASGMGSLTLGSDGGGSVRGPSSYTGLFGMKASFGRVPLYPGCRDPRYPGVSSWETVEHIGPMTRTVEDAALLLSVVVGPDMRDRHSLPAPDFDWMEVIKQEFKGKKVAYTPDFGFAPVDTEVRQLTAKAAQAFADDLGCEVVEDAPELSDMTDVHWAVILRDSDLDGMRAFAEKGLLFMPHLLEALKKKWTAEDFSRAHIRRQEVVNRMWRFMSKYDLFLCPTCPTPAFSIGLFGPDTVEGQRGVDLDDRLPALWPFNQTGQPAASIPAGWTTDGLPVGLQIVGRHLDDAMVMRASAAYEQVRPWKDRWPEIVAKAVDQPGKATAATGTFG